MEMQSLEITNETISQVGSNIVSVIHMSSPLKECEGDIFFEAQFYDNENDEYGDLIPNMTENFNDEGNKVFTISTTYSSIYAQTFTMEEVYSNYYQITSTIQLKVMNIED